METCEQCGAERFSWDGGSHRAYDLMRKRADVRVCDDGRHPDITWLLWAQIPRVEWPEHLQTWNNPRQPVKWPVS